MGIDINGRGFSYVVLANGDIIDKGFADQHELLRIIKKFKVGVIATDNVAEVLRLGGYLMKRLGRLPHEVKVVQVTMVEPGKECSMEELVGKYFGITGKLSPEETAEYAARLSLMGIGSVAKLHEAETRIIIKASVSANQGGMSRNRFERNIAHRIRQLVREVKSALDTANLDYDLFYLHSSEGARSAVFVVYADKSTVRSVVRPLRSIDVKMIIESVPTDKIRFVSASHEGSIEASPSRRYVIVGVDPGIVTGIAILDLEGKVLHLHSGKNLSRRGALRIIYEYGTPVLVATDTAKPSDYARKLAAMVGAVLHSPERDLSVAEKNEIASEVSKEYGLVIKDPHRRDALAAAYRAFMQLKPKLLRVEEELRRMIGEVMDEAKAMVIKGAAVKQVVEELRRGLGQPQSPQVRMIVHKQEGRIIDCKEIVGPLESEVNRLRKLYEEAMTRIRDLENNYDMELRRDQMIRSLYARIGILEGELQKLNSRINELRGRLEDISRGLLKVAKGEYVLIVNVNTMDELNNVWDKRIQPAIPMSMINALGIDELIRRDLRVLFISDELSEDSVKPLWRRGLCALSLAWFRGLELGPIKLIDSRDVELKLSKLRNKFLSTVDEDELARIIREYRQGRI